ncbi:MaoC/PaaZ C-terminal domain-containing protein [Lysinibacillus odysseyi]|uniref:Dehydratase n=1 Tax=Lysinibacillus odysseyi 34hs-1 = NBRC 100172 TaxID=1220589 RepID=A0A0A3IJV8_9BACI|nr:MaoC/PaaZ C-terminal domain-containing protein [Lysinibacillus odysseyi]KGR85034.1 dehydratase [Lysinibacillus odysseyi 34hs-1 = NBRC 100172]
MTAMTEIKVGESLEQMQMPPVTRLDLIKYAGASGDFNPIHTIDEEATNAGLPGIIAHGMWTMGNLAKLFTPYVEDGFIEDYAIRFRNMVFIDDVLTLQAVLYKEEENKREFKVAVVNQKGQEVVNGTVVFRMYEVGMAG